MSEGGNLIDNFEFIEPGLYNIKQIIDIIVLNNTPWIELNINENSVNLRSWLGKKEIK